MTRRRVAVTGLGVTVPLGSDPATVFDRLMAGESAIRPFTPEPSIPKAPATLPAVHCEGFNPEPILGRSTTYLTDRYAQLGLTAALAAWQDAGLDGRTPPDERLDGAVCWGTGLGGTRSVELAYFDVLQRGRSRTSPMLIVMGMHNAAAAHIAMRFGLGGPATTTSVACASSAIAIGEALRLIRSGEAEVVVAGGSEAPLTAGMLLAWDAMRVLASAEGAAAASACRPFSADRAGLVLGEGGAALVLESYEHAQQRGARIYAELAGYGASCDHHHLAQPLAAGQMRALRAALDDAGLEADELDYVNAHGTGTVEGDPVEVDALRAVFGAHAESVAVSSTKSMLGHMLGAAGAVEALITVLALARQQVPPTAHLARVDPACTGVRHVAGVGEAMPVRAALSSSFAFGGSNAVLAFRRHATVQ
jgi:3-oxoacyl-[acyl-carrier-protein] synthase II